MKSHAVLKRLLLTAVALSWVLEGRASSAAFAAVPKEKRWADEFHTSACTWSSTGSNDFFILEPGHQDVYDGHEGTKSIHLEVTVLNETKTVAGVETRVVEEKETRDGVLSEISKNFFAICRPTNDVFYFGEEVDAYENGKIADHEGGWLAGKSGAKPGLFMPARPILGARFYQELAPGVAMDRVEIISDTETLTTPAGEFRDCIKTEETNPLEPGETDYKVYARGIGMIRDGALPLTRRGTAPPKKP